MTTPEELLRQARAALKDIRASGKLDDAEWRRISSAIAAIDAHLKQPSAQTGGSAEHMLQDQSRDLSRWLSNQPGARLHATEAAAAIARPSAVDYAALVAAAWALHQYAQGTGACIAFKRGAEWQAAQPSAPSGEPAGKWEGADEWMPLAWELCAEECGEDACTELVWEGGPVPEPWGDRWLKYEDEAKRLIALVRKHVPTAQAAPAPQAESWMLGEKEAALEVIARLSDENYHLRSAPQAAPAPQAAVQPLTDEQIAKAQGDCFNWLAQHTNYSGGMGGAIWDQESGRAVMLACAAAWGVTLADTAQAASAPQPASDQFDKLISELDATDPAGMAKARKWASRVLAAQLAPASAEHASTVQALNIEDLNKGWEVSDREYVRCFHSFAAGAIFAERFHSITATTAKG